MRKKAADKAPVDEGAKPAARRESLAQYIRHQSADGIDLVDFVFSILNGEVKVKVKDGILPFPIDPKLRMEAATWLADRGWGKPVQAQEITITPSDDAREALQGYTTEELKALRAAITVEAEYKVIEEGSDDK